MKRLFIAVTVFCTALLSYGEVSVGLNLSSRLVNNSDKTRITETTSTETGTSNYSLGVHPSVIILVNNNIEIVPFAGFTHDTWRSTEEGSVRQETGNNGFDLGCGLYFRIINGEILRFSIGPQFTYDMNFPRDSEAFTSGFTFGAPANIDLCFNDRFFMRASPVLVQFGYGYKKINKDRSSSATSFSIVTENGLSIGFFFTF